MSKRNPKRGGVGQFAALPHAVLKTNKYARLDGWSVKMLVDLLLQYNGRNNGDLSIPWSVLKDRGWRSKGSVARAERALRNVGFIIKTRQGGKHRCNLYAISWQPVNECLHRESGMSKLDPQWGETIQPPGGWKDGEDAVDPPDKKTECLPRMRTNEVRMRADNSGIGTHADRSS